MKHPLNQKKNNNNNNNKLPLSGTLSLVSVAALPRIKSDILEEDCMITSRYNEL